MTSNLGSEYLLSGINEDGSISEECENRVNDLLKASFRPEFINRLDEIIMFKPLTKANIEDIIALVAADINKRLSDKEISFVLTKEAKQYIADTAYDPVYGARPLKRFMQKNIETLLARKILEGDIHQGDVITIDKAENGFVIG